MPRVEETVRFGSSLEIFRDFLDLNPAEQRRFVAAALRGCVQIEQGVTDLSKSVYAVGAHNAEAADVIPCAYTPRIQIHRILTS